MGKSVIVLEFNELTPRLIDKFIADGVLPGFSRLKRESFVATTDAGEDPPALNPWIQWVTVHSGRPYSEHGVFHLADGHKYKGARIWDLVSAAGKPVWVCGSMNAATSRRDPTAWLLPDPWSSEVGPQPEPLRKYFDFVSAFVRDHTADRPKMAASTYLRFVSFMISNGLSWRTIWAAVKQLATEKFNGRSWARASVLDKLQFDVFKHNWKKNRPAFSTLFSNSTAHYQHFYWRNFEPSAFQLQPTPQAQKRYSDAIRSGYVEMDKLIQGVLDMADDETTVVLCTALSQQPMVKYDADGGKQLFKPFNPSALWTFAGVEASPRFEPVMSEKFNLVFESDAEALAAKPWLEALEMSDGSRVLDIVVDGAKLIICCDINQAPAGSSMVTSRKAPRGMLFNELFYPIEGVKSGMHHRDGVLWIRTPARQHAAIERKVALEEIAPTLLHLCDVEAAPGTFSRQPMNEIVQPYLAHNAVAA